MNGQLVAVGTDWSGGDADAAVWISSDGFVWSRVAHDESDLGGDGWQAMSAVVAFGESLVAVGDDWSSGGEHVAAVWVSRDGVSWDRIRDKSVFGGSNGQKMLGAATFDGILVAVGLDYSDAENVEAEPPDGERGDAAVWTSSDGYAWSRVPPAQLGLGALQVMGDVAGSGSGFVGVGFDQSGGETEAAVWTSPDGVSWTRVEGGSVFGGSGYAQLMTGVSAAGSGLVAVGFDGSDAAAWVSPDGFTWARVPHDLGVFGGDPPSSWLRMEGVVALGDGLVAVGHRVYTDDLEDAVVWVSLDGVTWVRMEDEFVFGGGGQQMIDAVVEFDGGLVAVGRDGTGGDVNGGVWVATPSRP